MGILSFQKVSQKQKGMLNSVSIHASILCNNLQSHYLFLIFCFVFLYGYHLSGQNVCEAGNCDFLHKELNNSMYSFKYSILTGKGKNKKIYAGGQNIDLNLSQYEIEKLTIKLSDFKVTGQADTLKIARVKIEIMHIKVSNDNEFVKPEKPEEYFLEKENSSIEIPFGINSYGIPHDGSILIPFKVEIKDKKSKNKFNEIQISKPPQPSIVIKYNYVPKTNSDPSESLGKKIKVDNPRKTDVDETPMKDNNYLNYLDLSDNVISKDEDAEKLIQAYGKLTDELKKDEAEEFKEKIKNYCQEMYNKLSFDKFKTAYGKSDELINCNDYGDFPPPTKNGNSTNIRNEIEREWEKTKGRDDVDGYKAYLAFIQEKEVRDHYKDAIGKIKRIESLDDEACKKLDQKLKDAKSRKDSLVAYQEYLTNSPLRYYTKKRSFAENFLNTVTKNSKFSVDIKPFGAGDIEIWVKSQDKPGKIAVYRESEPLQSDQLDESKDWEINTGGFYVKTFKYLERGKYRFIINVGSDKVERFYSQAVELGGKIINIYKYRFRIIGGIPPFKLFYSDDGKEPHATQHTLIGSKRVFDILNALKSKSIDWTNFKFKVIDKYEEQIGGIIPINKEEEEEEGPIFKATVILLIVITLGLLYLTFSLLLKPMVFRWAAKQPILLNQFKWLAQYKKEVIRKTLNEPGFEVPNFDENSMRINIKETSNHEGISIKLKENGPTTESISIFLSKDLPSRGFTTKEPRNDPFFYCFDLDLLWNSTVLNKIYIHRRCVAAIEIEVNNYLMQCVAESLVKPEVGGFLLGQYGQYPDGRFFTVFHEYVKSQTTSHDEYEVELTMEDLDDPLRAFGEYGLMGWFHTHPGHTVFLSTKDIPIQKNHFNQPFQVAMVTDPVSTNYDLAFFTWKTDKNLNDGPVHRVKASWFSWKELNDWVRAVR